MQISVTGKQLDVGEALRGHVAATLEANVAKYFDNPMEASVVVAREGPGFRVDLSVHVGRRILLQGQGDGNDPYVAFDAAADRLAKRLRRYKRRLRDHHRADGEDSGLDARQYVLAVDGEAAETAESEAGAPVIVAEMATTIETLSLEEAVMRMDLADLPALMFRNRGHGGLNTVFRRPDGHIGWIDPRNVDAR